MNHQCYLFQFVFFIFTFLLHLPQNVSTLSLDNEVEGSFFERTEALQQKKLSIANQKGHVVKDKKTDAPLAVHGLHFRVEGVDDPKTVADIFVMENMNSLRVENARNVRDHKIRATLAGSVVRYKQICNNIDVLESEIAVTVSKDNAVTFSAGSFRPNIQCPDTIPKFSKDDAINAASDEIGIPHKDVEFVEANLIIVMDGTESILTWQVRICGIKQRYESNEYIYNALNGDLIRAKSMISDKNGYEHLITHQSSSTSSINRKDRGRITKRLRGSLQQSPDVFFSKLEKRVSFPRMDENETNTTRKDGFAYIFDPNPLATAKAKYTDPGFGDNCGFNSAELKKQLRNVTLQGLLFERNTYYLNGKYAQYHNFDLPSPFQIPFLGIDFDTESKSSSPDFSSDRRHGRFEATNAFYSIEKYLRYVEEDLGIQIKPTLYDGGIRFDPRGAFGLDNSYYDTISQRLAFGEGGVDDSEDDDVVVHELGHFIHDMLTDGSVSTVQGLSEGFSDYIANSNTRSRGIWTPNDEEYYWVFPWDGHNEFWSGRVTNYNKKYPDGLVGSIHKDGQIFSSCNMRVWDILGRENSDKVIFTGLSSTVSTSNLSIGAIAILNSADGIGISKEDKEAIKSIYRDCGLIF